MSGTGTTGPADHLHVAVEEGVHVITLNRPAQLNALTIDLVVDLIDVLDTISTSARVVVIAGAGDAFSSGADLSNLEQDGVGDMLLRHTGRLMVKLRDMPVPVVAAVSGPAAGIGCLLALMCDYVVMAEDAYYLLPFTKIGLLPDGGATAIVAASVGRQRALQLALSGARLPAETAREWGLAAEVVPHSAQERAHEVARRFACGATRAIGEAKVAINQITLGHMEAALEREAAGQARLHHTHDFVEGVTAFREKRSPKFTGA